VPLFDLSTTELETYLPQPTAQNDFDEFWATTLDAARDHELAPSFVPADYMLDLVEVFDTSFCGWNGERVSAGCCCRAADVSRCPPSDTSRRGGIRWTPRSRR
jgi:cephalosporin-C deacetylase-like acetyl esterase